MRGFQNPLFSEEHPRRQPKEVEAEDAKVGEQQPGDLARIPVAAEQQCDRGSRGDGGRGIAPQRAMVSGCAARHEELDERGRDGLQRREKDEPAQIALIVDQREEKDADDCSAQSLYREYGASPSDHEAGSEDDGAIQDEVGREAEDCRDQADGPQQDRRGHLGQKQNSGSGDHANDTSNQHGSPILRVSLHAHLQQVIVSTGTRAV